MSQVRDVIHQVAGERLRACVDQDYLVGMTTVVPGMRHSLGVRVPKIRGLAADLHREHRQLPFEQLLLLLHHAFAQGSREEVLCYIFWLAKRNRELQWTHWLQIDSWLDHIADWELCDQLAMGVAAPLLDRHPQHILELQSWTSSESTWRRRFVMACAASLQQRGRSHPIACLELCHPLLNDPKADVRKAVAWALREITDADVAAAISFLRDTKSLCHRTVLREGSRKLSKEQRHSLGV